VEEWEIKEKCNTGHKLDELKAKWEKAIASLTNYRNSDLLDMME